MRNRRGFTLIELMVVVCIVAITATILYDRMMFYREAAEKTAMEQTLVAMRSGLQLQLGYWLVRGDTRKVATLPALNPVQTLVEPPPNYGGELPGSLAAIEDGRWYFDAERRELVYRPVISSHLEVPGVADKRLRFRVDLIGGLTPREPVSGVRLVPVVRYVWDLGALKS